MSPTTNLSVIILMSLHFQPTLCTIPLLNERRRGAVAAQTAERRYLEYLYKDNNNDGGLKTRVAFAVDSSSKTHKPIEWRGNWDSATPQATVNTYTIMCTLAHGLLDVTSVKT
jgi:hypothetical protein